MPSEKLIALCCLCGERPAITYCPACGHYFCPDCKGNWWKRGKEALNSFLGDKSNLKCKHPAEGPPNAAR